jgi:hypothetical protein
LAIKHVERPTTLEWPPYHSTSTESLSLHQAFTIGLKLIIGYFKDN